MKLPCGTTSLWQPSSPWVFPLVPFVLQSLWTITAAFQMEDILYQLRDHSLGLNCGRWDYFFSFIKKEKTHPDKIAKTQPDWVQPWLRGKIGYGSRFVPSS